MEIKDLAAIFVFLNFKAKSPFEINLSVNIINTFVEQSLCVKRYNK